MLYHHPSSILLSSLSLHSLLRLLERCCAHDVTLFLSVYCLPPCGMDAEVHLIHVVRDNLAMSSLASLRSLPGRWWLLHCSLYSTTMNFCWVLSCHVAEKVQSAGSHHVRDWLALCHLPHLRICHMLPVRNADDLPLTPAVE